jgi:phenylalanyl-tRNA synthetase beta chain
MPGLLENIKTNQAKDDYIGIYEIGRIFLNKTGADDLPFQEKYLGIILAGAKEDDLFGKLKGVIEYLLGMLNLETAFKEGVIIYANKKDIGRAMEVDSATAQAFGIKKKSVLAEIKLNDLFAAVKNSPAKQFSAPPKYPPVVRDLAFVINEKILYNKIKSELENFSDLIKQVELFDVYQGGRLGADNKSLAFHIIYQADKTLTSEEADEVQAKLIKHLENKLGAKIRDF